MRRVLLGESMSEPIKGSRTPHQSWKAPEAVHLMIQDIFKTPELEDEAQSCAKSLIEGNLSDSSGAETSFEDCLPGPVQNEPSAAQSEKVKQAQVNQFPTGEEVHLRYHRCHYQYTQCIEFRYILNLSHKKLRCT